MMQINVFSALLLLPVVHAQGMMNQNNNNYNNNYNEMNGMMNQMNQNNNDMNGMMNEIDNMDQDLEQDLGMDTLMFSMLAKLTTEFEKCGIDLTPLMEGDNADGEVDPTVLLDMLQLSEPCSKQEESTMRDALLQFESCSGYEILEMDQALVGILSGVIQKCVNDMSMMDMMAMKVPKKCVRAILGHHPLGQALRDFLLRPGATKNCFETLSQQAPTCSIDLWPFPVDGKSIQQGACLSEAVQGIYVSTCTDEQDGIKGLEQCLPDVSEISAENCAKYEEDCLGPQEWGESNFMETLMMLPANLQGMPLPDTCRQAPGLQTAVAKYEAYRSACLVAGKEFWEQLDNTVAGSENALETFHDFLYDGTAQNEDVTPTVVTTPHTTTSQQELNLDAMEKKHDNSDKNGGSFGYGMLMGALLLGLGYIVLVAVKRKITKGGGVNLANPGFVELRTMDDAKPSYLDQDDHGMTPA